MSESTRVSQSTGIRVADACSRCGVYLEAYPPPSGRLILGASDGSGLMVRQFCSRCWCEVYDRLRKMVVAIDSDEG